MSNTLSFKNIPFKYWILLLVYAVLAIIMTVICFFPLISELSYRNAYMYSTEASLQNKKYLKRYLYAFDAYEKARTYFPYETHYGIEYVKDLEKYASAISNKKEKVKYFQQALSVLDEIQHIDSINPWYHSRRAIIDKKLYELTKDPSLMQDAIYRTHHSAITDYENPIFLLNYANLLHQNKRYNEAMYYYQRSIDIDTRFPEAHFNIADIYTKFNHLNLTIKHYLEVKKQKPNFKNIDMVIIKAYISNKQFDKAEEYIQTSIPTLPTDPNLLETLAYFYYATTDYTTSLKYFNAYFSLPKNKRDLSNNRIKSMYIETLIKDGSIQKARSLATQFIDESNDESFKTKLRSLIKNTSQ